MNGAEAGAGVGVCVVGGVRVVCGFTGDFYGFA